MMALHHLSYMVPSRVVVKNNAWTPTVPDSKNAFFKIVKNEDLIAAEMKRRSIVCKEKEIKDHPMVFESKIANEVKYFVGVGNFIYECTSFIDAVDAAFKIFVTFKIPFPPECAMIWLFLNEIFYKINLQQKPSAKLIFTLNSFQL